MRLGDATCSARAFRTVVLAVICAMAAVALVPTAAGAATPVRVKVDSGSRPSAGLPVSMNVTPGRGNTRCTLRYTGPRKAKGGPHRLTGVTADKQVIFTVARDARLGRWTIRVSCGKQSGKATLRVANDRVTRGRRLVKAGTLKVVARAQGSPSEGGGAVDEPGDGLGRGAGTGGYAYGYCTYYVWTRRADLAGLGHAGDWYGAARGRGIPVGPPDKPVAGAAAWWSRSNPQTDYLENGRRVNYGHIAYVEETSGNRIRVSEMNWSGTRGGGWNRRSERWITLGTAAAPEGFIYGGPAGDGPGATGGGGNDGTVAAPGSARIGALWNDGSFRVKEGDLHASWVLEMSGVKTIALSGDRIGALGNDGTFYVKQGGLEAPWVTVMSGVKAIALSGDRIGALGDDGRFHVKEGDLYAPWVLEMSGVKDIALSGDRIGALGGDGRFHVKDGGLHAGWVHVLSGVKAIALSGNRIGGLGDDGRFLVKDGLYAEWVHVLSGVKAIALSGNRIGGLGDDGRFLVKDGLYAEWVHVLAGVKAIALSGERIAAVGDDGRFHVKHGGLQAEWVLLADGIGASALPG